MVNAVNLFCVGADCVYASVEMRTCLFAVVCDIVVCMCAPRHLLLVFCISALASSLWIPSCDEVLGHLPRTSMYGYACLTVCMAVHL
jgi:hypothetical protein